MSTKATVVKRAKSAVERAWSTFRRSLRGKADCVVVCQLWQADDGTWECEYVARHWVEAPDGKLPPGVPGAILVTLGSETVSRSIGGVAGMNAGDLLRGFATQAAQQVINPRGRR